MEEYPLISAIVPVYNGVDYIKTVYGGTENYIVSLGITKETIETFKDTFLSESDN